MGALFLEATTPTPVIGSMDISGKASESSRTSGIFVAICDMIQRDNISLWVMGCYDPEDEVLTLKSYLTGWGGVNLFSLISQHFELQNLINSKIQSITFFFKYYKYKLSLLCTSLIKSTSSIKFVSLLLILLLLLLLFLTDLSVH